MFFNIQKYIYSENLFNTLYIKIKHRCLKNFFQTKKKLRKMHSFFFREHQLIAVLLSIRDSYASWITRFVSLKVCVGFFIFDSASFFF